MLNQLIRQTMRSQTQHQLCLLLILVSAAKLAVAGTPINSIVLAMPGCNQTCGNMTIPYPFGIGPNCFHDSWFEIECKNSTTPFLSQLNIQILKISLTNLSPQKTVTVAVPPLKSCSAQRTQINLSGKNNPYTVSTNNVFMMQGCSGNAVLLDESNNITAGCATACPTDNSAESNTQSCHGVQCCKAPIVNGFSSYHIDFDQRNSSGGSACLVAALMKTTDDFGRPFTSYPPDTFPMDLDWKWVGNVTGFRPDSDSRVMCERDGGLLGSCYCLGSNEYGNPYVPNGCQVPRDCRHCRRRLPCVLNLDDEEGHISFHCYFDIAHRLEVILGPSVSFGIVFLGIGLYKLYHFIKRRRKIKQRAKFFKRNGGLLLQQQLSANEGALEETKIYTVDELEKATDNFNENRILGKGGQGTVFKGMLVDGRIVAIKKANLLDETQLEQFINEVVILSQINHRNVVKMFGCCLETEVPLLVYEFIPNGTLSEHIHDADEDFVLSWEMRLKIAADSASAIAYLHSSSSTPIFHRDIKSSNILLDEKYRARVSDFGSSRTIAIDQTHMTTLVQGTLGYLDPEYFQSYQFTEKSDVYSFGVVLLEILTGKNPIYMEAGSIEQKNLVTEFLIISQTDVLSNILDSEIEKKAKKEEVIAVAELAKNCTSLSGRLRPTMKEVAMTLEMIMNSPTQAPTCCQQAFQVPSEDVKTETTAVEFISNTLPVTI